MNRRIEQLKKSISVDHYVICSELGRLITESWRETDGEPDVIRTAKAQANVLNHSTIFIEEGQLIVGNPASKMMGVEYWVPSLWTKRRS